MLVCSLRASTLRFFLPLLLLAVLFAGCGTPDGAAPSEALTDDIGRAVAVPPVAERVLTLAPNLTELLAAAGGRDRLVAVSQADDYPPDVDTLPRYGTFPLDYERVLTLQPDLLIANAAINRPEDADRLAAFDVPTYFFSFETLADVPRALQTIGEMVGTEAVARAAANDFEADLARLRARAEAFDERPRTLVLIGDETLYAFGGASYTQELIALAGGESITARFSGEGVTLSEEFVLEAQPEVIIGAFGADYDTGRLLRLHPTWRGLPAVRDGRVHSVNPDLLFRPGPRLVEGAEQLFRFLHPEAQASR